MKTFVLSSFAAFLLMLVACKKSADQPAVAADQHYTIDSFTLSYLKLPIGTWYAYKDSVSGLIDTVVIKRSEVNTTLVPSYTSTYNILGFRGVQQVPAIYYDSLILHISKDLLNGTENWLSINYRQQYSFNFIYASDNIIKNAGEIVFWNPAKSDYGIKNDMGVESIPSITIEGKTYQNVLRFVNKNGSDTTATYYIKSDYYWAQGVGVIKRSLKNAQGVHTETLLNNWK